MDPGDECEVGPRVAKQLLDRADFERLDEPETCEVVKSDGELCGRDLPCQYHSDETEDGTESGDSDSE